MDQLEEFDGVIAPTQAESRPWWPEAPHPGEDAPDVVVILLDDTGFSDLQCYGSEVATPNMDALAAQGPGKHYWVGNSNGVALVTLSESNGVLRYISSQQ